MALTKLTARIATECESKAEGNVPSAFWIFKGKNVGKVVLKVK